jgi:hypothetical protein
MRSIVVGFVSGLVVYLAMTMVFGLGLADSMFIALTIATAAASAIALSEREANLGVVAAFVAIAVVASLLKFIGFVSTSAILVKLPNADIYIPTDLLPYLALALVGLLGVARALNWSIGRTMLVILGMASWLAYYIVPDQTAKLFSLTLISIISAIPLVSEEKVEKEGSRLLSVAPIPIVATIDLTAVNYAGLLVPVLLFIAVDPTKRIKSIARDLAAICILSLVLLMVFGITMGL